MSDNQMKTTGSFASRLLNKELNDRSKKTTQSLLKINPADAAKYAVESEEKETVTTQK